MNYILAAYDEVDCVCCVKLDFLVLISRLEEALGVDRAVGSRLAPRRCLSALGVA